MSDSISCTSYKLAGDLRRQEKGFSKKVTLVAYFKIYFTFLAAVLPMCEYRYNAGSADTVRDWPSRRLPSSVW